MARRVFRAALRWPKTVQGRVVIAAVLATGVLLLVAGLLALELQESSLRDELEDTLSTRASDVAALVASDAVPGQLAGGGEHSAVQIVDPTGRVIGATAEAPLIPLTDSRPAAGVSVTEQIDGVTEADHPGVLIARGATGAGGTYTVIAAEDFEAIDRSSDVLSGILRIGLPTLLIAIAVITALAVRRALAPVERITSELDAIGSETIDSRVGVPKTDDEIAHLARTGNALLDRLEAAYRREQRFVADASHELRNPIATLRSSLEIEDPPPGKRSDLIQEVARLENLVDDLLHLARREEGRSVAPTELLDLDDIVLEEVARAAVGAFKLDAAKVSAAQVRGVRGDLVRVVRNLIDNAVRYGESQVEVSLSEDEGRVELVIDDDGPGIPVDQRESVFERFARVDRDRSRLEGGTGLGLAIAKAIVVDHAGTIAVSDAPIGGARIRVSMPSAVAAEVVRG